MMKWIITIFSIVMAVGATAADGLLVRGTLKEVHSEQSALELYRRDILYTMNSNVVIETVRSDSNYFLLLPGLDVSLHSEDGRTVSRIFIHGPSDILDKALMD